MRDSQKNLRINPQKTQGGKVKFILTYLGASNVFTGEYLWSLTKFDLTSFFLWPIYLLIFSKQWWRVMTKWCRAPPSLTVHEGSKASLNCSYKVTNFQSLHWYKQEEKVPTFLFALISTGIEKSGRLTGTLDKKELLSILHITVTKPGDSATYLCAAEAWYSLVTCGRDPNATTEAPATVRQGSC